MTVMTIYRNAYDLPPLVIPGNCQTVPGYWLGEGTVRPEFTARHDYAPDSAWVGGRQLLGVVREQGAIAASIYAKATSPAELEELKVALEEALWQFAYAVEFNDGAPRVYQADPVVPAWGQIVPGHDKLFVAWATVSIPVNP